MKSSERVRFVVLGKRRGSGLGERRKDMIKERRVRERESDREGHRQAVTGDHMGLVCEAVTGDHVGLVSVLFFCFLAARLHSPAPN